MQWNCGRLKDTLKKDRDSPLASFFFVVIHEDVYIWCSLDQGLIFGNTKIYKPSKTSTVPRCSLLEPEAKNTNKTTTDYGAANVTLREGQLFKT